MWYDGLLVCIRLVALVLGLIWRFSFGCILWLICYVLVLCCSGGFGFDFVIVVCLILGV